MVGENIWDCVSLRLWDFLEVRVPKALADGTRGLVHFPGGCVLFGVVLGCFSCHLMPVCPENDEHGKFATLLEDTVCACGCKAPEDLRVRPVCRSLEASLSNIAEE